MAITLDQAPAQPARPRKFYQHLYVQVLAAIAAGILLGHFWPEQGAALKPLGDAFIKLVKMIIAPVIFLTVSTGIAGMSDMQKVGRVAGKAMIYFLTFSTLARLVGLVVANVVQPGSGMHIDPAALDAVMIYDGTCRSADQRRQVRHTFEPHVFCQAFDQILHDPVSILHDGRCDLQTACAQQQIF